MGLTRVVLVVVVLFIVWRVAMAVGRRAGRMTAGADDFSRFSARRRDHRQRMKQHRGEAQEELVECRECGTWVPAARAVVADDGALFCTALCRDRRSTGGAAGG